MSILPSSKIGQQSLWILLGGELVLLMWPAFMLFVPTNIKPPAIEGNLTVLDYVLRVSLGVGVASLAVSFAMAVVAWWKLKDQSVALIMAIGLTIYEILLILILIVFGGPS